MGHSKPLELELSGIGGRGGVMGDWKSLELELSGTSGREESWET